ncbi:MAG TPA: hypothetical protein IGS52_12625 [Oscillatoriaceae cyanobacterium M33_DOE_052]|uniref:Uncharacterized protein n=1 Tax=Planktothricoides sp. SpSt-374 TaxID=2282167 RepID=A0A7C3VG29_9CYAN|nr:hypothetical protein [Oscillatoriaceae cyanobacterium M33_DOE_052]
MNHLKILVDFHNADKQGRLRLNCVGTIEDLSRQSVQLQPGHILIVYSEELEADGVVQYSEEENLWVAVIDWQRIREVEEMMPSNYSLPDRGMVSPRS